MLPDNLTITEQIIKYKDLIKDVNNKDKALSLYEEICNNLSVISYYLPQTELSLSREDAADFMLYFRKTIPNVIKNYDVSSGNIFPYLFHCIKMKYRSFISCKKREQDIENAIQINSAFLMTEDDPTLMIAEDTFIYGNSPKSKGNIQFVKFIFKERPYFRKCFFVYLISLAPDLTDEITDRLCELFNIDLEQTKKLIELIKPAFYRKEFIKAKDEKKMNINWIKSIRKWDLVEDRGKHTETVTESSEKIKKGYKLPRNAISDLLNETRATIFSSIYKIKKIFLFLDNINENGSYMAGDSITSYINKFYEDGSWEKNEIQLKYFKPYDEFKIDKIKIKV